jgi:hypothetical protein
MYGDNVHDESVNVFSFVLILYELLVGGYVFSPDLAPMALMKVVTSGERPPLPDEINLTVRKMILRGWSVDPMIRESFDEIWRNLAEIKFRLTEKVDSSRVLQFLSWVRANEPR